MRHRSSDALSHAFTRLLPEHGKPINGSQRGVHLSIEWKGKIPSTDTSLGAALG
ncbi:hypothetical protein [Lentzea xinjiangensis]|uniref:hypothetical protein n=1 Tax=Lentzea xinjiangensis TaxID=402600 RepID=UPI0015A72F06|nr:hypothetical protein [Lentzea xinjiangensis]